MRKNEGAIVTVPFSPSSARNRSMSSGSPVLFCGRKQLGALRRLPIESQMIRITFVAEASCSKRSNGSISRRY